MGFRAEQLEFMQDMSINKGCKKGVLKITGTDVYKHLKHESGVHKVQRVPETEKAGRLHSSTAVVLIMPEVPREFTLDMKEVRLDFYRAQGAGG
jgi:peptide chain release factor 1